MQSVRKQYLEDLVLNAVWKVLNHEGFIHIIAENIFEQHQNNYKTNHTLKNLESKRNAALKASKNLISAIEQGVLTEQTVTRLKELENEIAELEANIETEKMRSHAYLTIPMIEEYLTMSASDNIDDISVRKDIVNIFVREVIYYPEKVIITMNFINNYVKDVITPERIEKIEKQSTSKAALKINGCSNIFTSSPPKIREPRSRIFHFCPHDTTSFARLCRATSFVGKAHNFIVRPADINERCCTARSNEVLRNEVALRAKPMC